MAAIVPLVTTFVQAGSVAGMAAMATSSVAGFLQVGGAVLSAVGAVTGKKSLAKFGALMSLGAGIANLASGASSATSAADGAKSAASEALKSGVKAGAESAFAAIGDSIGVSGTDWATNALEAASAGGPSALGPQGGGIWDTIGGSASSPSALGLTDVATSADPFGVAQLGIMDSVQRGPGSLAQRLTEQPGPADSVLARDGSKLTLDDVLKTVGNGIKATPEWIRRNPELSKFGFSILEGIYGPGAQAADEQQRHVNRRLRNINTPIRMTSGALQGG